MTSPARKPETGALSLSDLSARAFMDEREAVAALLKQVEPLSSLEGEIMGAARRYAETIRGAGPGHGMEAFLHTYGLDTREGVALMCLAEALLRIPDADTADRLIHDTFEGRDWRAHMEEFMRVGLWIFDGFSRIDRNGKNSHAIGFQDSSDFGDGFLVIRDMLQHVRRKYKIIRLIAERKVLEINGVIDPFHLEIRSFILTEPLRKKLAKEWFRSEVQHPPLDCRSVA